MKILLYPCGRNLTVFQTVQGSKFLQWETDSSCLLGFLVYSMFHVTWITLKFNRSQLGTVSAFVMISVPWSNQCAIKSSAKNTL